MSAQLWPNNLPPPVFGGDNFRIAQAMSAHTRNGRVPQWSEAEAYARDAMQDAQDDDCREGFAMKYGAACGAD